jgi:hypothetical protein
MFCMVKLLFFVNIVVILISILFFRKTISISKGPIIKVRYTKSGLLSEMVGYFVFSSFIIYIFYISNSYVGWKLLMSLPFTALVLSPFFGIIKRIKSDEILSINPLLNSITFNGIVYDAEDISNIRIVKRIGQNSIGTDDYVLSLITITNNEMYLVILEDKEDAVLVIDELARLLKLPIEYYKDGGFLGIIKISRESI